MTKKKEVTEGFDPNLLTPSPRRSAPQSVEERQALSGVREPQVLLTKETMPKHMRTDMPPELDTTMPGIRSVNENTASFKKMMDDMAERKRLEAIDEANNPRQDVLFSKLNSERDRMKEKASERTTSSKEAS